MLNKYMYTGERTNQQRDILGMLLNYLNTDVWTVKLLLTKFVSEIPTGKYHPFLF